ncbi:hypothetical protein [Streptomyces sp. S.PB5]|uniref:hypothetical protein n=1 Tax=Streptomyces sp. S.PB5 TaxID=3020844 RepID=UPI0025B1EDC3|nr:hypothetical protein [Streptomyces sp. S.PB5]MDN3023616.1 hypothetical protein [Streptomyces sp. S.PB5]
MYLIHVRLRAPAGTAMPSIASGAFSPFFGRGDGVEHISAHLDAPEGPTLGFFIVSSDLAAAEETAFHVSRQVVAERADLQGFTVVSSKATLAPGPWWDEE